MSQFYRKSMAKGAAAVLIGTLVATSFSGCSLFPNENNVSAPVLLKAPEASYKTQPVKRGSIVKTVTGSGIITSRAGQNLSFTNHGGRLTSINVKAGDDVKKGDVIAQLDTDSMQFDLQKARIELQKAQVAYQMEVDAKSDSNRLKLSELDVEENQLQVDELEDEIQKATIIAPISGKIVFLTNARVGDQVEAFETIAGIGDESQVQIECTGSNIDSFKIGMKAQVQYNNNTYAAEVVTVPAASSDSASQNKDKAVAVLRFDKIPSGVKLGDNVNVSLILEKKDNVIVIPADKVKDYGGKYYVSVLEKGSKVDKLVEIGIKTDTEVEITKGLTEGENYITES